MNELFELFKEWGEWACICDKCKLRDSCRYCLARMIVYSDGSGSIQIDRAGGGIKRMFNWMILEDGLATLKGAMR